MSYGFVVLQSYIDAINELPEERRWPFFCELFDYRMNGAEIHPQSALERMAVALIKPIVDGSAAKYAASVKRGEKGGQSNSKQRFIPPETWIPEILKHGSIPKAAASLGIVKQTLYNWVKTNDDPRLEPFKEKVQKSKNQDIDMDMDKDTDTDIFTHNKKENAPAARAQSASPRREPTREESIEVCKRLRDSFLEMTGRDEGGEQKPNS